MFDSDTLMEIYSYLVELRTIKRNKLEYEILHVGSADSSELTRIDALLDCFADFFRDDQTCLSCKYADDCPEEYKRDQPNFCENWENL